MSTIRKKIDNVILHILKAVAPLIKSDEQYIKMRYHVSMHKKLNLTSPQTFNEKLSWLKLHAYNPQYSVLVDKYAVKEYVASKIGEEYIIPTIGVFDSMDDVDFKKCPPQFVIKCTHDSQSTIVVKDKNVFNEKKTRAKLNKCLKQNFFWSTREYPYKDVKPRIIIEEYIEDKTGGGLNDYKFFCFNGVPKLMFIATGRPVNTCFDFYDMDFNHIDLKQGHPNSSKRIQKPEGWDEMIKLASILSKGYPHVRVDFYNINGKVYFGELTFFHFGADMPFEPNSWDLKMGEWLELPKVD